MPEMSTPLAHLRLERPSDGVVVLTLDNPDMRNAMSEEMTESWVRAIDQLAADRSVRVVVVTGGAVNLAIRSFVLASAATAGC